jgi:hypothetical protein
MCTCVFGLMLNVVQAIRHHAALILQAGLDVRGLMGTSAGALSGSLYAGLHSRAGAFGVLRPVWIPVCLPWAMPSRQPANRLCLAFHTPA